MLQTFLTEQWNEAISTGKQEHAIEDLEKGNILYFPKLAFEVKEDEKYLLSPEHADPDAKNISYHSPNQKLWGVQRLNDDQRLQLMAMLERFIQSSLFLLENLLPTYRHDLILGRTSFRPVQISGRVTSYRKDDKRLHVDAFPSAPNQGKRILRVFSNINFNNEDRVWRIGETFEEVAKRFLPRIKNPLPGSAAALRLLKITKSYRTLYDHYMLNIHDCMKADNAYQQSARQQEVRFRPGSTWIVQTDHVSHAAMEGQYVLEQTFYLPVSAMRNEAHSPLRVLERMLKQSLT